MQGDGFIDTEQAGGLVGAALSAVVDLREGSFWKLLPDDLLQLGRDLEQLSRVVYAAQVHPAGEVDTAALAAARSCRSIAALLRQNFNISTADAVGRVKAARHTLPRHQPTSPDAPPLLPHLRCDTHHLKLWSDGGATCYDNLALLCPYHHTQIHRGRMGGSNEPGRTPGNDPTEMDRRGKERSTQLALPCLMNAPPRNRNAPRSNSRLSSRRRG